MLLGGCDLANARVLNVAMVQQLVLELLLLDSGGPATVLSPMTYLLVRPRGPAQQARAPGGVRPQLRDGAGGGPPDQQHYDALAWSPAHSQVNGTLATEARGSAMADHYLDYEVDHLLGAIGAGGWHSTPVTTPLHEGPGDGRRGSDDTTIVRLGYTPPTSGPTQGVRKRNATLQRGRSALGTAFGRGSHLHFMLAVRCIGLTPGSCMGVAVVSMATLYLCLWCCTRARLRPWRPWPPCTRA